MKTALWIIRDWGGIKRYSNVNKLVQLGCTVCKKDSLSMNQVSSLSKVASFLDPENYAVYDSRVVYTLNWFIFSNGLADKFFFQPRGRSSKIRKEDQDIIFNAVLKKVCYLYEDECYAKYIEVLKGASKLLGGIEIYKIEMFLFAIAPSQIYKQVKSKSRMLARFGSFLLLLDFKIHIILGCVLNCFPQRCRRNRRLV